MANIVGFKKGLLAKLPEQKTPGMLYVTTDEHGLYLDVNETTRIRLCDIPAETYDEYGAADKVKSELNTEIAKKQDKLVFETDYDPEDNKVATMTDVTNAVSGLSGAMHWKGTVDKKPDASMGASYQAGDVVSYQGVEYAWDGSAWQELGDESKYSEKVSGWDNAASKAHEHDNKDALDEFEDGDKDALDQAVSDIEAIKDGTSIDSFGDVETELAKKQDTIPANTYDAYGAAAGVKAELVGEDSDTKDEDTIKGAKAFATDAANTAKTDLVGQNNDTKDKDTIKGAKAYADDAVTTALTWGEF